MRGIIVKILKRIEYWKNILRIGLIAASCGILFYACNGSPCDPGRNTRALVLLSKNWGLNYFLIEDELDNYGWERTEVAVLDSVTPCPPVYKWGVPPRYPDKMVMDLDGIGEYDCLIIPPGTGNYYPIDNPFQDLVASPAALRLIGEANDRQLPIFAMCAGVRVLAAADVMQGKNVLGSRRFNAEYAEAGARNLRQKGVKHAPVIDGNLVTAMNGQQYNMGMCLALSAVQEDQSLPKSRKITVCQPALQVKPLTLGDADVQWARSFGSRQSESGRSLCATADGGYLLAGYTFAGGGGGADILVIKTTAGGQPEWLRSYGGAGNEYAHACTAISDGFLITGYTSSGGNGSKDLYLLKIDQEGRRIWDRSYGGDSWDVGMSVCALQSGDYAVCGFTKSFGVGEEDIYVLKIDPRGRVIWRKTFGGSASDYGYTIRELAGGQLAVAATVMSYGDSTSNPYLLLLDSDGKQRLGQHYTLKGPRGYGFDWCKAMTPLRKGGFALTGYTDCTDILDGYILRTDADGKMLWSQTAGNQPFYDYGNAIVETADGHIILCGATKKIPGAAGPYDNNILLAELDARGELQWQKSIGTLFTEWGNAVVAVGDGLVVLGHHRNTENGDLDLCLLKIRRPKKDDDC